MIANIGQTAIDMMPKCYAIVADHYSNGVVDALDGQFSPPELVGGDHDMRKLAMDAYCYGAGTVNALVAKGPGGFSPGPA